MKIPLVTNIPPPNRYAGFDLPDFGLMKPGSHSFFIPGDNPTSIRNTVMSKFRAWKKEHNSDGKLISDTEYKKDKEGKNTETVVGLRFWRQS